MTVTFTVKAKPQEEVWKDIDGFFGEYQVSNLGRIKSLDRIQTRSNGRVLCNFKINGVILSQYQTGKGYKSGNGYLSVSLNNKSKAVHILVAKAFVSNKNKLPQVNHIDGNKYNNNCENLEYCTASQNAVHAVKHCLRQRGEDIHCSKLKREDIINIRKNYLRGSYIFGALPLSRDYGVSPATIKNIVQNKKWRWVNIDC
jgi:hypothetical protein